MPLTAQSDVTQKATGPAAITINTLIYIGGIWKATREKMKLHRYSCLGFILLLIAIGSASVSWGRKNTAENSRVLKARVEQTDTLNKLLSDHQLRPEHYELFMRAFKHEGVLELWARANNKARFVQLKTYPICAASGVLGSKKKQGDRQVPEGFYRIDRFNPQSRFHLSLGLNYPNAADRQRITENPGGDIFIHGDCASIGCLAMGDSAIEEIYLLAEGARNRHSITVHIFPTQLNQDGWQRLNKSPQSLEWHSFWQGLQAGYDLFEAQRRLPEDIKAL